MAKQKSGLGRGLNALFSEEYITNQEPYKEVVHKEEKILNYEPAKPASSTAPSVLAVSSNKNAESPAGNTKQTTSNTEPSVNKKSSSSIYFSEDAVENAKVVEREVRKTPTLRISLEQKRKTADLRMEQEEKISTRPSSTEKRPVELTVKDTRKEPKNEKGSVEEVDLTLVQPNPDQPRTNFKPEEIEELANSIKKEGLLQPILVHKVGDHYQIIAGERRWQACKSLNMKKIPVRFWSADADKALELALIENIQRSDLNPIEEAYGYKRLMERKGMTQSEVAQTVSKGRSTIANALRLLDLPEEAQQLLFEEKISAGHARAILSVPTPEGRKTLTNKLINEKLSVRETEAIARLLSGREKSKAEGTSKRIPTPPSFKKAAKNLSRFLSAPVRVKTVQGKNKIEIQFKDEEELQRILTAISEHKNETQDEE